MAVVVRQTALEVAAMSAQPLQVQYEVYANDLFVQRQLDATRVF